MNIKNSSSSAKNKIFLGFWFVLFAVLILIVNWVFSIPVNRANDIIRTLDETDKEITRLTALHASFLLGNDKEDNLFITSEETVENEAKQIIGQVNENILFVKGHHIANKKSFATSLDVFSKQVNYFNANLNNLILIVRERGNKKSGLVLQWTGLSQKLLDAPEKPGTFILQRLNEIKQLETDYLLNRNIKTLEDIAVKTEEIRNQVTLEESSININDLDAYTVLTGNLVSIEKRMGHNSTQGVIPDLEASLHNMPSAFTDLNQLAVSHVNKVKTTWTIIRYIAILLIISLFIHLFVNVFSLIDPLRQILGFTRKMANGEFPEQSIAVGKLIDMQYIKEALDKHIASLKDKFAFIQALNKDDFNAKLVISGETDLISKELVHLQQKIIEANEKQAKNEKDNLVRRYMNEGLARFADILRSKNNDMQTLGDAFIRELVKYLNALQGGLFLFDDTDKSAPVLRLISAFAYNRKKYLEQTIAYGEGLVGTCAREKQFINLTEIPQGYITITSGLGETPPDNLLLVPVLHENELLGVIELASLNKFRDHEVEFSRQVAFSMGSTLINTRNNQKTTELLTKSQQQALEMAEQEEEMRQNMEELKATQEESGRREEQFRGVADAIGNAMLLVEYSLDGKILEVNDRLCHFLGKEKEALIGKTHFEAFNGNLKTDADFWNTIRDEGFAHVKETIKIGRKTFELIEHFAPVLNRNSNAVKFINFATDGRIGNS
jgi:PAS domain S-box-containing protein